MKIITKHYKIKYGTIEGWINFLKLMLKPRVKEAKIFHAGIGEIYLTCKGEYNDSPCPSETQDFHDVINEYYNFNHRTLSAKPNPQKNWSGSWKTIDEEISSLTAKN